MVDEEKLLELAKTFDSKTVKVMGSIPGDLKASEVIGCSKHCNKTTKISYKRKGVIYLCWVNTSDCMETILRFKKEISGREDWSERWEPWEIHGSTEPFALRERLLKSRLKNSKERSEFNCEGV